MDTAGRWPVDTTVVALVLALELMLFTVHHYRETLQG